MGGQGQGLDAENATEEQNRAFAAYLAAVYPIYVVRLSMATYIAYPISL